MEQLKSNIEIKQLIEFGLNPLQWITTKENEHSAEFVNIDDPELKFTASISYQSPQMTQIVSLEWIF